MKQNQAQQSELQEGGRLSKEKVWDRINAQVEKVFRNDKSMRDFLNFMAQCTPQSTQNLLILYEQNPSITQPRTSDRWKEAGRTVSNNAEGYLFFTNQEYQRQDGTRGSEYVITKVYDISQTRGPRLIPPVKHLPEEIIAAMIEQSPVPLAISDQLPQKVEAQYVSKQRTIYVRNGMDETTTVCAIAKGQAHAGFDTTGGRYYRPEYAVQAYCAAYVTAQKFGLDTSVFRFDKVCKYCAEMRVEEKREFIGEIKRAAYTINQNIQRYFQDMDQTIQPDEFSIEAEKPAKSSKTKDGQSQESQR